MFGNRTDEVAQKIGCGVGLTVNGFEGQRITEPKVSGCIDGSDLNAGIRASADDPLDRGGRCRVWCGGKYQPVRRFAKFPHRGVEVDERLLADGRRQVWKCTR